MILQKNFAAILAASITASGAASAADAGRKLDLANDKAYEHVIVPIFAATCTSCHGAEKAKGKFRLHTPEEITKSETVVGGKPGESTVIERIFLPGEDEDVMPPEGKKQLTEDQKKLIRWWVAEGASFDKKISELNVPADIKPILTSYVYAPPKVVVIKKAFDLPEPAAAADAAAVGAVAKAGVLIMPLAQDTKYLSANAINVAKSFNDAQVKLFVPLSEQLTWLDVSRSGISDASAADIGKLTKLTKLHLENTAVTDATLAQLGGLQNLEYLNLYGTKVTDAGLAHLKGLKKLKKLYVWQTGVTEAGAKQLQATLPEVEVNLGWKAPPEAKK